MCKQKQTVRLLFEFWRATVQLRLSVQKKSYLNVMAVIWPFLAFLEKNARTSLTTQLTTTEENQLIDFLPDLEKAVQKQKVKKIDKMSDDEGPPPEESILDETTKEFIDISGNAGENSVIEVVDISVSDDDEEKSGAKITNIFRKEVPVILPKATSRTVKMEKMSPKKKITKNALTKALDWESRLRRGYKQKTKALNRAELDLGAVASALHPQNPSTSTPKHIGQEEMKENLRYLSQCNESFHNANGKPSLERGTWPDYLSFKEARKENKRGFKHAKDRYPDEADVIGDPNAYDTGGSEAEVEDSGDSDVALLPDYLSFIEAKKAKKDALKAKIKKASKPIGVVLPTDKLGNLLNHGKEIFRQGSEVDTEIGNLVEELPAIQATTNQRRLQAWKENFKSCTGHRRRLLAILIAQQEKIEDLIRRGIEPPVDAMNFPDVSEVETEADQHGYRAASSSARSDENANVGDNFTDSFNADYDLSHEAVSKDLPASDLRWPIEAKKKEDAFKSWAEKAKKNAKIRQIKASLDELCYPDDTEATAAEASADQNLPETEPDPMEPKEPSEYSANQSEPEMCSPNCTDKECVKIHLESTDEEWNPR